MARVTAINRDTPMNRREERRACESFAMTRRAVLMTPLSDLCLGKQMVNDCVSPKLLLFSPNRPH